MKTSDTTRHTIVLTGLIFSLGSFAFCGLLWLSMALGYIKQSTLYSKTTFHADMSANFTLDLVLSLAAGLIAGLLIGSVAKMLMRPKHQHA